MHRDSIEPRISSDISSISPKGGSTGKSSIDRTIKAASGEIASLRTLLNSLLRRVKRLEGEKEVVSKKEETKLKNNYVPIWNGERFVDSLIHFDSTTYIIGMDTRITGNLKSDNLSINNLSSPYLPYYYNERLNDSIISQISSRAIGIRTSVANTGSYLYLMPNGTPGLDCEMAVFSNDVIAEGLFGYECIKLTKVLNGPGRIAVEKGPFSGTYRDLVFRTGPTDKVKIDIYGNVYFYTVSDADADVDKILVLDSSDCIKYRTGVELLGDIGAASSLHGVDIPYVPYADSTTTFAESPIQVASGNVGIACVPQNRLHVSVEDTNDDSVTYPLKLTHSLSGTVNSNVGVGIQFEQEDHYSTLEVIAAIDAVNIDPGSGATSSKGEIVLKTLNEDGGGLAQRARLTYDGQLKLYGASVSSILNYNSTGREILLLRAKNEAADGASINLYGNTDSTFAGELKLLTNNATRMTIKYDGKIGIGVTSPDSLIHAFAGSAGTVTAPANTVLTIENSDACGLSFLSPATKACEINFGDPGDVDAGKISYDHATDKMNFTSGGFAILCLTADGVGIGTTSPQMDLHVNGNMRLSVAADAEIDTDRFLVLDANGNVDYRTGEEVAADIADSGSFTATLSDCTTTTTGTVYYHRIGKIVFLIIGQMEGTSNAATLNFTGLPTALRPSTFEKSVPVSPYQITGGAGSGGVYARISTGGTVSFYAIDGTAWTDSGSKGFSGQRITTITYALD